LTPEEERTLALRILNDLLEFKGFVRSININFKTNLFFNFEWCYWIEYSSRSTRDIKIFTHYKTNRLGFVNKFIESYSDAILSLKNEIRPTCSIEPQYAEMLKDVHTDSLFVAIPNLDEPLICDYRS